MASKLPHRKSTILSVLALVAAMGGYGGYTVVRDSPHYNPLYDYQVHTVQSVTDGDTIILSDDTRVRLLGINAPESSACFGLEARQALTELIEGREVRLEKDTTAVDEFGRYLRYVYLDRPEPDQDNLFVNHWLVEQGYARDISGGANKRYRQLLLKARESAESAGRGLWGECESSSESQAQSDSEPTKEGCVIKGNISTEGAGKSYFLPGCGNYGRVKVDTTIGEQYFCTRAAAENAGFTLSASCTNNGIE